MIRRDGRLLLPLEIAELAESPALGKALVLLANLATLVYLVWRKRLFLDRRGREHGAGLKP